MKNINSLLVVAFGLSAISFGYSTGKRWSVATARQIVDELPIRFAGYQQLYAFIASRSYGGIPTNPTNAETLFKLAADSCTQIVTLEDLQMPYVHLVETHYYNGGVYDRIRGAQGNGNYYILRPLTTNHVTFDTDKGFDLVGIVQGNSWKVTYHGGRTRIVTRWHMSAAESPESIYEWNGKFFELVK